MLDKLNIVKQRFDEVSDLIIQPDIIADQKRYVKLNKEYKDLKTLVDKREIYINLTDNLKEAEEILADGSDAEMVEMAKMQMEESKEALPKPEDNESPTNSTESSPSSNLTKQTKKVQLSSTAKQEETPALYYTGVTCFMGLAPVARPRRGICFPSSLSSKFHAVFFPTAPEEQCFQLHFPVADLTKAMETWGAIPPQDAQKECCALAAQLRIEGWHEDYLKPLENVTYAIRIGFALLQPRLKTWVYGSSQPLVVLLGDAAHPPVPYLGQGAQMGLEDAGTLSLLLKHMCLDIDGQFQATNFRAVTKLFEQMRLPRTRQILENSQKWGKIQQQRADDTCRNQAREKIIKREVFFHEALPILFPGATFHYEKAVQEALARIPIHLAMVKEKEEETESTPAV